jgi:hypothetical protein
VPHSVRYLHGVRRVVKLPLILLASISCAADVPAKPAPPQRAAVVIWKPNCKEQDESAFAVTLLAALAPKVIDTGITFISNLLKERAEQYQITHVGRAADTWGNVTFSSQPAPERGAAPTVQSRVSLRLGCVITYSGDGGAWPQRDAAAARTFYPAPVNELPNRPAVFFMATIEQQAVGTRGIVFRLIPEKFSLARFTSRGRSAKDVVVSVRFRIPEAAVANGYSAEVVLPSFSSVSEGDAFDIKDVTSDWLSFPALQGNSEESFDIPASVEVTILETDRGNGALIANKLAEGIDASKESISKAVTDRLTNSAGKSE